MRKQTKLAVVLSAAALLAMGASMTSFAKGWEEAEDGWVYLDSYGDRVYNEWKKSGADYYYLNDDGVMATDYLVPEDINGNIYYVDATGKKVTNTWVAIENVDGVTVGPYAAEVDTLWYYFDGKGKAVKASSTATKPYKASTLNYAGGKGTFLFDVEGHMLSGWVDNGGDLYYLGDETEGWARTGWQYLEPNQDTINPYEDSKWFYFGSNGKAHRAKDGANSVTKYINKLYYTFNEDGVLMTDWYTASTPAQASGADAYASSNGSLSTGWVYTEAVDGSGDYWYYLVNIRDNATNTVARSIPFGYAASESETEFVAKSINGKTFLFNRKGEMQTGLVEISTSNFVDLSNNGGKALVPGLYYFSEAEGTSKEGMMVTGRVTLEEDGEQYFYHFAKDGRAYKNTVKDGVLYDADGERVQAMDGNYYMLVDVTDCKWEEKNITLNGKLAVNASGRIKTSGQIKIDDQLKKVTINMTTGDASVQ